MSFRLQVPRPLYDALLAQAVAEAPNECCGLLAGAVRNGCVVVARRYPLTNAAASPVLYEADSRELLAAHREIDRAGLEIVAVYHSHPTSRPVPSKTDLARNFSEDVVSVIVSLLSDPPEVRAWWLTATDYREAEWEVV